MESKSRPTSVMVYNRDTGRVEPEAVMGEGWVRFLYETSLGRLLAEGLLKRRSFSRLYGLFQNSRRSAGKIPRMVSELRIDPSEAEKSLEEYRSFNDFFTRAMKEGVRPIDPEPSAVISPCDARLLALPSVEGRARFHIKGCSLTLSSLLGDENLAAGYTGGTMLVYRLCPADYHRFHFPEAGTPSQAETVSGGLHSVNPIALSSGLKILDGNLRQRTLLDTQVRAGPVLMMEVGALCVGSIVQTYTPGRPVERGEEKGMFRFGGSTVIVLYEPGRIRMDEDILIQSRQGIESLVKLGTPVGSYL